MTDLKPFLFAVTSALAVILFISFSLIDSELLPGYGYVWTTDVDPEEFRVIQEEDGIINPYIELTTEVLTENESNEEFEDADAAEIEDITTPAAKRLPLMLGWTKFHGQHMVNVLSLLRTCPWKCDYTKDRSRLNESDAVVYHGGDLKNRFRLQTYWPPGQVKVLFMRESPGRDTSRFYEGWSSIPLSFFNITMTYYKKSTYWEHYNLFDKANPNDEDVYTQEYVNEAIANKTEGAYFAASHCGAESKRERLIAELSKYTNVTKYGKCSGSLRCDRTCEKGVLNRSHFYLALENSVCEEYITEKFFKGKRLIVPITFKRSLVEHLAPPNSFIAVDDFCSVEELGKYLNFLMENKNEYRKYFEWTKHYRYGPSTRSLCNLCRDLTYRNATTSDYSEQFTNIKSFMNGGHCDRGFTAKMMRNRCNGTSAFPDIPSLGLNFS